MRRRIATTGRRGLIRRLLGNEAPLAGRTLWTLLLQAGGLLLGYVLNVALARWMAADAYGVYAYALSWIRIVGIVACLGLPHVLLRYLPTYEVEANHARYRGLLTVAWRVVAVGALLVLVGTAAMSLLRGLPLMSDAGRSNEAVWILAAWTVPVMAASGLLTNALRAHHQMGWAYAPNLLVRPLMILAVAFGLRGAGYPLTAASVLAVVFGVMLLLQLARWVRLRRMLPVVKERVYALRTWAQMAGPLFVGDILNGIASRVDVLVLGIVLLPELVGPYAMSVRTAAVVGMPLVAINAVFARVIAMRMAAGDTDELQQQLRLAARWTWLAAWPLALVVFALAEPILAFFGPGFISAVWPLRLMVVGYLLDALIGPVEHLLTLTGHQVVSMRIVALTAGLNLGLSLLLIPWLGVLGAACSLVASITMSNLVAYLYVRRTLRLDTMPWS